MTTPLSILGRGIFQLRNVPASRLPNQTQNAAARRGSRAEQTGDLPTALLHYQHATAQDCPPWVKDRLIATLVALRRTKAAAELLDDRQPYDALHHAALCVLAGDYRAAAEQYQTAISGYLHTDDAAETAIQSAVDHALELLAAGAFTPASAALEEAARMVETLLTAHIGWCAAEHYLQPDAASAHLTHSLPALLQLDDALLRHRARALLASNVADMLLDRRRTGELALAAAGAPQVGALLKSQLLTLESIIPRHGNHAELHHRAGMLSRVTGDVPGAVRSWMRTMAIFPAHPPTAARLAATLAESGDTAAATRVILDAAQPSPRTLASCHRLAVAAADPEMLDQTLTQMGDDANCDRRANLAYTLAAMGLSDAQSRAWRNPFAAEPAQTH